MLDHVGIEVGDLERSRTFYEKALEPLGVSLGARTPELVDAFHATSRPSATDRLPSHASAASHHMGG